MEVAIEEEGRVLSDDLTEEESLAPGRVLHRCIRSLRFANLSWVGWSIRSSSTHSRS